MGLMRRVESTQIAGGIHAHLNSQGLHPADNFVVALPHGTAQKCAPRASPIFTEAGQLMAAGNGLFRAICLLLSSLHWVFFRA